MIEQMAAPHQKRDFALFFPQMTAISLPDQSKQARSAVRGLLGDMAERSKR
jgi:hypothetical protein